ncbi:DUF3857 domain-containing protein [Flavobacterium sp. J27]|uniref:DUF3857 domain-containing protein n=1 Tax=Flavobacterium sp. J27 TaxID=2060419 RepID=UPI001031A54D|nr:DUF3857 domain-containing protein [Flavobacterium sp. J27]
MKIKLLFLLFISAHLYAQNDFSALLIPKELKEKANSAVQYQKVDVIIKSQNLYKINIKRITTVFNEYGLKNIDAREYYSKSEKINKIEATIYDAFGKELKKIRRKEFIDQSVADGFSLLSDNRVLYLEYTPIQYPFTIVYESEKESINTAFLPSWMPVDDYYESVLKSEFNIQFVSDLGFKYKEQNFDGYTIERNETSSMIHYTVENIPALKPESHSPSFKNIVPNVIFGLEKFSLEGVAGSGTTWEDFGKIYYDKLINTTTELNPETIKKINDLTQGITDPIEKAKIIYSYVQGKTRYVSIQLGIGGWKPMLAKDVDRLGYGDCKALSNYTRVLLDHVGVKSYYTVIYGDRNKRDINKDFVSYQGNHVILTIPLHDKNYFLECTSQTNPFAFGGDFTDDRYALMIKPEGGFIVKTNEFKPVDSYQKTIGNYTIDQEGNVTAKGQIVSGGIQYDNKAFLLRIKDEKELHTSYKNRFNWISNLKIEKLEIKENHEAIELVENIVLSATNYSNKAGNTIYFPINLFNKNDNVPDKYRNRKNDFVIMRGYFDIDEIEINLPKEYDVEFLPEEINLDTEFGNYKMSIEKLSNDKLRYKREFTLKEGHYSKEKYEDYRKFRETISKQDNSKIVLTKI